MAKTKKTTNAVLGDDDWRARDDVRTLAEAKVIMADKQRVAKAAKEAQKMAEQKKEEAKAMSQIARKAPKTAKKK